MANAPHYPFKLSSARLLAKTRSVDEVTAELAALTSDDAAPWLAAAEAAEADTVRYWAAGQLDDAAVTLAAAVQALAGAVARGWQADEELITGAVALAVCANDRDLAAALIAPVRQPDSALDANDVWVGLAATLVDMLNGQVHADVAHQVPAINAIVNDDAPALRRLVTRAATTQYDKIRKMLHREDPNMLVDWVTTALLVTAARQGVNVPRDIALYPVNLAVDVDTSV